MTDHTCNYDAVVPLKGPCLNVMTAEDQSQEVMDLNFYFYQINHELCFCTTNTAKCLPIQQVSSITWKMWCKNKGHKITRLSPWKTRWMQTHI